MVRAFFGHILNSVKAAVRQLITLFSAKTTPVAYLKTATLMAVFVILTTVISVTGVFSYTRGGASAAANSNLNFQARLLSNTGNLVADGSYNIEFKIYKSAAAGTSAQSVCSLNASTDDCYWLETRSGANTVTVKNGYFSVNLGSVTAFGTSIPWDQDLWMSMRIGGIGAPSWDTEMTPRFKLTAVPYAYRAGKLLDSTNTNAFTADDLIQKAPTVIQTLNSTLAAIRLNQQGTGGLLQLQKSGSDIFTIDNGGSITSVSTGTNTFNQGATGQLSLVSDLTSASRSTSSFSITQADNATNSQSAPLLTVTNSDLTSTGSLATLTQSSTAAADALVISTASNTTAISVTTPAGGTALTTVGLTSGTAINADTVTTGTALSDAGLTSGTGLTVGSGNAITTGVGLLYNTTSNAFTTGKALNVTGSAGAITADFSGAYINVNPTRTLTAAATRTDSGNFLNLTRVDTVNNAGATYNVIGALANLQSTCTQTAGSCSDSSNILNLSQQYANATGAVLNVSGAGTGNLAVFNATNAAANGVSINVQSNSNTKYAFKVTSNNGAINGLNVLADGTVQLPIQTTNGFVKTSGGNGSLTVATSIGLGSTDVSGTLGISNGGTNSTATPTAGGIAYGAGTAFAFTGVGIAGQCLTSNAGSAPTWASCAGTGSGTTLQAAFNNGNTILTTDARDFSVTLANTTTSPNAFINIAAASTGRFAVQNNGADIFGVNTASGVTIGANAAINGNTIIGSATTNRLTLNAQILGTNALVFQGATDNAFATTFAITDPTANRTITVPDASGTLDFTDLAQTFSASKTFGAGLSITSGQSLTINASTFTSLTGNNLTNTAGVLGTTNNPSFTTSVTTPLLTSSAGLTINSGNNTISIGATNTAIQRIASGTLTFDLNDAGATTFAIDNSAAGAASINLVDGGLQTAGTSRLTNAGVLQNITGLTIASGGASVTGAATFVNDVAINGNTTIGSATTNRLTLKAQILGANAEVFQGATDNAFTTTLSITDPTANNTIIVPDVSGTILLLGASAIQTDSSTNVSIGINKTGASGNILTLQKNGTSVFTVGNDGAITHAVTSTAALVVNNGTGTDYFTINTSGALVQIGSTTADATGVMLVLDTKNTTGDPTGQNGGMYYNSAVQSYRCYRGVNGNANDGIWESCGKNPIDHTWNLEEDFISGNTTAFAIGSLGWNLQTITTGVTVSYNNAGVLAPTSDRPGILRLRTNGNVSRGSTMSLAGSSLSPLPVGAGTTIRTSVANFKNGGANSPVLRIGEHSETISTTAPTAGVWWEADTATNANWRYCYGSGAAALCAVSSVAIADNTWYRLEIRVVSTTAVDFFINGIKTSVTGITLDTTTQTAPALTCFAGSAVQQDCFEDYYQISGGSGAAR